MNGTSHRKRIAASTIAFVALLVLVHFVCRSLYITHIESLTRPIARDRAFRANAESYDVLVLGNSHPFVAVDEALLGRAANLSDLDEGYMLNYFRLKHILEGTNKRFTAVVLPLSLHGFRPVLPTDYEPPYRAQLVEFRDLARESGWYRELAYAWFRGRVVPYAGCSDDLLKLVSTGSTSEQIEFMKRMSTNWDLNPGKQAKAEGYALDHFKGKDPFDPISAHYFGALLDLCAEHDIRVVLVEYPVTKLYFECVERNLLDYPRWQAFVDGMLKGREGVVRLDYKRVFDDTMFCDPLHVNMDGRVRFTEMLKREMEARGLLASPAGS